MDRNVYHHVPAVWRPSHSARGAWIETLIPCNTKILAWVALREGCVDRNPSTVYLNFLPVVALREGCVDRNYPAFPVFALRVSRTPRGVRG